MSKIETSTAPAANNANNADAAQTLSLAASDLAAAAASIAQAAAKIAQAVSALSADTDKAAAPAPAPAAAAPSKPAEPAPAAPKAAETGKAPLKGLAALKAASAEKKDAASGAPLKGLAALKAKSAELKDILARAMGGRIAEKLIFGTDAITTGASSDLKNVAELAKSMIVEEGMGANTRNLVFPGEETGYYTITTGKPYSEKTAELIDAEVKDLSDEAARRAEIVLKANKKVLDNLAEELLKHETLEETELEPVLKEAKMPAAAKLY